MRKFAILFLLLIPVITAFGQGIHDWEIHTYLNDIRDLEIQDGQIWAATSGGAYRFDPADSSFHTYTNIDGMGALDLSSVTSDNYGRLIFGGFNGVITMYDRADDLWQNYFDVSGETIADVSSFGDTLWVATNSGVGVYIIRTDGLEFRDFYSNLPVSPGQANRITVFNNKVYYATNNGVLYAPSNFIRYNLKAEQSWQVYSTANILPSNTVFEVKSVNDSLFIGTDQGAVVVDTDAVSAAVPGWANGYVSRVFTHNGRLYFIRSTDYYQRINGGFTRVETVPSQIKAGLADENGTVWLGLRLGGLRFMGANSPLLIDGPGSNHVGVLLKGSDGNLWVASGKFKLPTYQGFYKYDFNNWENYRFFGDNWSRLNSMVSVYEDRRGDIWFGSWSGGVVQLSDTGMTFFHGWDYGGTMQVESSAGITVNDIPGIPAEFQNCFPGVRSDDRAYTVITGFLEDDRGNMWISNYRSIDRKFIAVVPRKTDGTIDPDCSNWKYFGSDLNLDPLEGEISQMIFDDFGRLWFGTFEEGIRVIDYNGTVNDSLDDKLYEIRLSDNLFSNTILALAKDRDGVIWIGTDAGLNSYDGQNFYKHVGETGPIENKINQIVVDDFNNKWFATEGGISILEASRSPWEAGAWHHFTTENSGLPHKTVNGIFVDSKSGAAYIGTEAGLAVFHGAFAELKTELNSMIGGPNPFLLQPGAGFTIKNIAQNATVKILDINGRLVRILNRENGNVLGGRARWDGRDGSGAVVSSGIYLYLVYNDQDITGTGKISVIKP
jgi:ligand-binding sensor domain-containing protein